MARISPLFRKSLNEETAIELTFTQINLEKMKYGEIRNNSVLNVHVPSHWLNIDGRIELFVIQC
ncbi:hypothetical protein BOW14_12850 [Solemya velum gill symbiont]|nr:hypothetical protein BOW14_12850 [Solemya velum gill symbiont]